MAHNKGIPQTTNGNISRTFGLTGDGEGGDLSNISRISGVDVPPVTGIIQAVVTFSIGGCITAMVTQIGVAQLNCPLTAGMSSFPEDFNSSSRIGDTGYTATEGQVLAVHILHMVHGIRSISSSRNGSDMPDGTLRKCACQAALGIQAAIVALIVQSCTRFLRLSVIDENVLAVSKRSILQFNIIVVGGNVFLNDLVQLPGAAIIAGGRVSTGAIAVVVIQQLVCAISVRVGDFPSGIIARISAYALGDGQDGFSVTNCGFTIIINGQVLAVGIGDSIAITGRSDGPDLCTIGGIQRSGAKVQSIGNIVTAIKQNLVHSGIDKNILALCDSLVGNRAVQPYANIGLVSAYRLDFDSRTTVIRIVGKVALRLDGKSITRLHLNMLDKLSHMGTLLVITGTSRSSGMEHIIVTSGALGNKQILSAISRCGDLLISGQHGRGITLYLLEHVQFYIFLGTIRANSIPKEFCFIHVEIQGTAAIAEADSAIAQIVDCSILSGTSISTEGLIDNASRSISQIDVHISSISQLMAKCIGPIVGCFFGRIICCKEGVLTICQVDHRAITQDFCLERHDNRAGFFCMRMTRGEHAQDHDKCQQKAQKTFTFVFHLFILPFTFCSPGVLPRLSVPEVQIGSRKKCWSAPPPGCVHHAQPGSGSNPLGPLAQGRVARPPSRDPLPAPHHSGTTGRPQKGRLPHLLSHHIVYLQVPKMSIDYPAPPVNIP